MKMLQGLVAWLITTSYVVYAFTLNTAASVFSPAIQSGLSLTSTQSTLAVTWFIIAFALFQIPAGWLLDRYPSRFVVSAGVFILAAGNLLISHATSYYLFSAANFVQGIGASFAFISAGILVAQWFSARLFPVLFGLTQSVACTMAAVLHYYFSMSLTSMSWQALYLQIFYAGCLIFIASICFVKNPETKATNSHTGFLDSIKKVGKNPQLWYCTIALATSFGVLLAYAEFWYNDVQIFYGINPSESMITSGMIFVGIAAGTPFMGYFSNLVLSRIMIIQISLALGVMCLLAGIYLPHFPFESLLPLKTISFFIGFFLSGSMLFFTIVNEIFPEQVKGIALSISNTGLFLVNSLLLFAPYCLTTSKVFFTRLWLLPAILMIAFIFLYFIKESWPETQNGCRHEP